MVAQARFMTSRFKGELQARNEEILNRDRRLKRLMKQKAKRFKPLQTANFQEMLENRITLDKANMSLEDARQELDKMENAFVHVKLRYAELRGSQEELQCKIEFYEDRFRQQDASFIPYKPAGKSKRASSSSPSKHKRDFASFLRSLRTRKSKRDGYALCIPDQASPTRHDPDMYGIRRSSTASILILPPHCQDRGTVSSAQPSGRTTPSKEKPHGGSYFGKGFKGKFRSKKRSTIGEVPSAELCSEGVPSSEDDAEVTVTKLRSGAESSSGSKTANIPPNSAQLCVEKSLSANDVKDKSLGKSMKNAIRTLGRRNSWKNENEAEPSSVFDED